ncbi:AraC family transcriptional regulator [Flavobacteriaceae bacterium TP-CH-4]|uniref:AraC family transcriptional regulator n=1 Tax=Pelagihabitans pacificus TaxID=2696054 RepID=A0A967ATK9_9FLAO|nr:helix-turn-helix domain-containing protein [Pelagihabitans pacificus]NHF60068.1 AraC family transcriptional regulator [Pelagihabitans pacificus]
MLVFKNDMVAFEQQLKMLRHLMEYERIYRNPDLNLTLLGSRLRISERSTSKLIQRGFEKSYTTFVNDYRLEEVLYRLRNRQYITHTIIGLALEAGFPSKSTFYRFFKERLEMSPSEFVKRQLENKTS